MAVALSRDPYKTFRFKIWFVDGTPKLIAGANSVSGLSWNVDVFSHGEGGSNQGARQIPGSISFDPVTISRGLTSDNLLTKWAEGVWDYRSDNPFQKMRRDIKIELCDEMGMPVIEYVMTKCWVSSMVSLPDLSADDNAIAFETVTFQHEGWTQRIVANGTTSTGRMAGAGAIGPQQAG